MQLSWLRRPDVLTVMTSAPTYVATSEVLRVLDPMDLTPLRFLGAALIVGCYLLWRRRGLMVTRRDLAKVLLVGLVGYAAYGTLLNLAQTTVPAGTTSLLLNTAPVFAFVLGYLVLGERTKRRGVVGLAIAVVGAVVVTVFGGGALGFDWNAVVLIFASLAIAIFLILQQPLLGRIPAAELVFWGCLIGGVATLPLAPGDLQPAAWELRTWFALVVLVASGTALAYTLWNVSLAGTSVAEGGSLLLAIPLFSIALGWILLGQQPTVGSIVGGTIAVGGVVIMNRGDNEPHRPATESTVTMRPVDEEVVGLELDALDAAALQVGADQVVEAVGARLVTVSLWRPEHSDLVRIHTSMPEVYRLGGISAELGAEWVQRCVVEQESYMAESPTDLESDAFEHHDTLAALRLGAAINAVIADDGRFLGCLNAMDGPGSYEAEDLAAVDAIARGLVGVLRRVASTPAAGV